MSGKTCTNGCDRPVHGRGLCAPCYTAWWLEQGDNRERDNARRKANYQANPEAKRAASQRYKAKNKAKINAQRRARYASDPEFRERQVERSRNARSSSTQPPKLSKPKPAKVDDPAILPVKSMKEVIAELRAQYWNPDGTRKGQK